ncbi:MAG: hypothetical protein A2487_09635 [Candidatus Raymondbacteria bacterium RifOxyC12_full_50_8]|nr:MAG: hypothetical protein A2487_09635 [Candidatus Raymondbacteria bacterium RifOxyC12_full_50_8]
MPMDKCLFSFAHYRSILVCAKKSYTITSFAGTTRARTKKPLIILRHDLDSSLLNAHAMAHMERSLGVRATYFIQLHSDFYSVFSLEGIALVREIASMNHEIGLHYDPAYYNAIGVNFKKGLAGDLEILESIAGQRIISVSRHLPLLAGQKETFPPQVQFNAFDPSFINGQYKYLSDSNGVFRQGCFCQHLSPKQDYCFLVHPVWWTNKGGGWKAKLAEQARKDCNAVRKRIAGKIALYDTIMASRKERDCMFRKRQGQ